jgi:hypothetical protein
MATILILNHDAFLILYHGHLHVNFGFHTRLSLRFFRYIGFMLVLHVLSQSVSYLLYSVDITGIVQYFYVRILVFLRKDIGNLYTEMKDCILN